MNDYSIALFLHIVGALGLFVTLGLEWTGLRSIQRAMILEQVRPWMGVLKSTRKFGFGAMLATVITGIYLTLRVWGDVAWIIVTLGSLVLVMALAQVLTAPRMAAVGRALVMEKGALSETFHSVANQSLLSISIQTRVAIALGIVFLKIAKPDLAGSLLTIGVAAILGIASTLPMLRRERAGEGWAS
jgi:hypothetical protein